MTVYRMLAQVARKLGPWVFLFASRCIAVGYFFFGAGRKESYRFYNLLYPGSSWWYPLWCTFCQYQCFTTIHYDRFLRNTGVPVSLTAEAQLSDLVDSGGILLLMSHLGNWEMAAQMLMQEKANLELLLYMGVKDQEGVERTQKEELSKAGVRIIGVDRTSNSPFNALEGIKVLQRGGVVSMTGDIVWRSGQRHLPVSFLGHQALLPEAPFVFALVSGCPLVVFFAFRQGTAKYMLSLSKPIYVKATRRADRKEALLQAAQCYAYLLETALRSHPYEWYHFDRFVHEPYLQDGLGEAENSQ